MHFVLFDAILEEHTVRSLERALSARGHRVTVTGPIWRGHYLPKTNAEMAPIRERVRELCKAAPDVLFNLRASSLLPEMVNELKAVGTHTVVWLADDPVLYHVCYRHVVDAYDTVLHCGGEVVLAFYQERHGRAGFNFPYWTDDFEFGFKYDPTQAEFDLVFLGNCRGAVRAKRYDLLSSLPFRTRIFGKVDNDPYGLCDGYLETTEQTAAVLGKAVCAINIPQYFRDYKGTEYDFPELAGLGHFQLPSRVVQYAAIGLPILSLEGQASRTFPELIVCADREELIAKAEELLRDEPQLRRVSAGTHARFKHSFSAAARAAFLESLVESPDRWGGLSISQRAESFASILGDEPEPAKLHTPVLKKHRLTFGSSEVEHLPSIEEQREKLRSTVFEYPHKWRILHFGTDISGYTDVVGSIRRSLTNLGHTVLHIDVRRHKDILVNPPERVSSRGPIFIDLRRIMHLMNRFQPQIIICNAGGLCFSPDDCEQIKSRGILLLGMTLSDPDVQETMLEHVGRFDYHTTNSVVALERYREAGASNTVLFPFGIDPGYIIANVPPEPEFRADLICIGHAENRPERESAMTRLAREFNVRVYGKGWQLPGAGVVHGQRKIQASREGRIHVNFAKTLAGYANVKCGVFESIGSGAVLCTSKFEEMEKYFEYGEEIIGFESEDDLCGQVREILADEMRYETIRRQAFHRLVTEHLYEHRWQALFKQIEHDIFERPMMVSADRAQVLQQTLSTTYPHPRRVVISGFYGARNINTGDELILRSIVDGVCNERKDLQFIVASEEPANVERVHAYPAFERSDMSALDAEMSVAAAAVLGGGGLWHDYTFQRSGGALSLFSDTPISLAGFGRLLMLSRIYGRPAHVFGIGVGPLGDEQAKQLLCLLAEKARTIAVRDQESKELLEAIEGWQLPVRYVPEVVYALDLGEPQAPRIVREISNECPIIAVNLRPWSVGQEGLQQRVARALERVARQHDCALVGIPMQESHDQETLRRVFAMIRIPRPSVVLDWSDRFEELFGTIQASRALLAMRLHACLLGHRLGVPTLGIAYDPKVEQHFREVGLPERALSLNSTVEDLVAGLAVVLGLEGKPEGHVRQRVVALEAAARDGIHSLATVLGEAPLIRDVLPIRAVGPDDTRRTVDKLQPAVSKEKAERNKLRSDVQLASGQEERLRTELAATKKELQAVKGSVSYQLGSALIQSIRKPGRNTIFLPYRLLRLILRALKEMPR